MNGEGRSESAQALHPILKDKRILLFSPDADLARCLGLTLQNANRVEVEFNLEKLEQRIREEVPDLILVDLFVFSEDIQKQLAVIRRTAVAVPLIILRAYLSVSPEVNELIDSIADVVFYKPVDVVQLAETIQGLLSHEHH